jgi:hypothetical protein
MIHRLPLRVHRATFKRSRSGMMALCSFRLLEGATFPMQWPDAHTFALYDTDQTTILDVGRNGLVLASVKTPSEDPSTWKLGMLTPA